MCAIASRTTGGEDLAVRTFLRALERLHRLDELQSMTAMTIHYPNVPHRGSLPVFDHAILAPDGTLFLFFGSGDDELLLWQAPVSSGQGVAHSRVVCCWDEPGKPHSYSPPLKTEELSLDSQPVVWDPDNTELIPDSSALRWERNGISYSLLGRGLTKDEAVQVFLSLQRNAR